MGRRFRERGIEVGKTRPTIRPRLVTDGPLPPIGTLNDGSDVYILADVLRAWARRPADRLEELRYRGGFVLRVTPTDYFRLAGVEETHHAVSLRHRLVQVERRSVPATSSYQYHAQPLEFAALEEKITFAGERLGGEVVTQLQALRLGAQRIRDQRAGVEIAATL